MRVGRKKYPFLDFKHYQFENYRPNLLERKSVKFNLSEINDEIDEGSVDYPPSLKKLKNSKFSKSTVYARKRRGTTMMKNSDVSNLSKDNDEDSLDNIGEEEEDEEGSLNESNSENDIEEKPEEDDEVESEEMDLSDTRSFGASLVNISKSKASNKAETTTREGSDGSGNLA